MEFDVCLNSEDSQRGFAHPFFWGLNEGRNCLNEYERGESFLLLLIMFLIMY